jgi:type I restriction enzyme, S subunit
LLKGLEISEVNYLYLLESNKIFRFDSNYFQKQFLQDEGLIRKRNHQTLAKIGAILQSFGAYSLNNAVTYIDEGIPFIRGVNMKKGQILFSDMIYIDEKAHGILWKSEVKPEMVLLSMSGTIGEVALASKNWLYPMNSNQDIAKISTNQSLNPYYLYVFLLSKYGQNYLKREARGSVQQHVFLSQIEDFEIPILKPEFIEKIQEIIESSESANVHSKTTYAQAEGFLLEALGLTDFVPSAAAVNEKSFKDSFLASGRLDAEYYQPKYEQVVKKIESLPHSLLSEIVHIKKSVEPGSDFYGDDETGIPFLRVADYDKSGLSTPKKRLNTAYVHENITQIDNLIPKKDTILFSKDGSVGEAYCLEKDANFITSSAILHLTVKNSNFINTEYLTLVLNSKVVQMQAERDAGGSIILHWRIEEIKNCVIPILNFVQQTQITELVKESFALKTRSQHLLESAKRAVEMAIEDSEEAALAWLDSVV